MPTTLGVILGNRGFFADELCQQGRQQLLPVLEKLGITPIILPENEGVYGSVESIEDAKKCAALFKEHREQMQGVVVSLPNFGDEKAIGEALRRSGLQVPVLVHAFPDELAKLDYDNRRDSFCGKISVCNNLRQYGIPYTLTELHTVAVDAESFQRDLQKFVGVCNVVARLKSAKVGVIGPRPADFNTVRFSEKILERQGISVEPIGLVDVLGDIEQIADTDPVVSQRIAEIRSYMDSAAIPEAAMVKMAKFLHVVEEWVEVNELDTVAIQCWSSIQKAFGINPCAVMSILSTAGVPAACEVDVMGALSMLALQAASGNASALVDWNNNFADDPDKAVVFHCGNYPKGVYANCCISFADILASTLGADSTHGAIAGNIKPGEVTFARLSTDDLEGAIKAYVAQGQVSDDQLDTFGSWGVVAIPHLQQLMAHICRQGFEHHVACNLSSVADILSEAFGTYLGWEVYNHK